MFSDSIVVASKFSTHIFPSTGELDGALARQVADILREAIALNGCATLAVSGGSTPLGFFRQLSREQLRWDCVTVTLVDERWVDENSNDSNTKLVKNNLLQNAASAAQFLSLKTVADSPFTAVPEVNARLSELSLPLTVAVLGMGLDGHTASFFPHAPTLSTALAPTQDEKVAAVHPLNASHDRITLTLPLLLDAKLLVLHLVGEKKWQVLQAASQPGDIEAMPIRAVLQGRASSNQNSELEVFYTASEA